MATGEPFPGTESNRNPAPNLRFFEYLQRQGKEQFQLQRLLATPCDSLDDLRQWTAKSLDWLRDYMQANSIAPTAQEIPPHELARTAFGNAFMLVPEDIAQELQPMGGWGFHTYLTAGKAFTMLQSLNNWFQKTAQETTLANQADTPRGGQTENDDPGDNMGGRGPAEGEKPKRRRGLPARSETQKRDINLYQDWKAANNKDGISKQQFLRNRGLQSTDFAAIERGRKALKRKNSGKK